MKTKISKILGVVLSAVMVASLFVFTVPVSAATQAWSRLPFPDAANLVMPYMVDANGATFAITSKGPMAQAKDGSALWVAATLQQTAPVVGVATNVIMESLDGGRTWPSATRIPTAGNNVVTAIAASPSEANVLYYAATVGGSPTIYKSVDHGTTFIAESSIPAALASRINSMAVSAYLGRYLVVVGTTGAPGNVYYLDENLPFFNFVALGTNDFATAVGGGITSVTAVGLSPTFATDRFTVAIGTNGATSVVGINQFGGAWGANIANTAAITNANTGPTANGTAAIAFTSDFSVSSNPVFFFGLGGTTGQGVYRFTGVAFPGPSVATALSSSTNPGSSFNRQVVSLDVTGTVSTAAIYAGNQAGGIFRSSDAGLTFSGKQLNANAAANRVYVQVKKGATTPLYILVGGTVTGTGDDTAFWLGTGSSTYHALSLINSTQNPRTMEITANGEYLVAANSLTGTATTVNDSFNIVAGGIGSGDAYTITSVNGAGDAFTLTQAASTTSTVVISVTAGSAAVVLLAGTPVITGGSPVGTAIVGNNVSVTFPVDAAVDSVTVTAASGTTIQWSLTSGFAPAIAETVDGNASMTVLGSGAPFDMDMNPTQVTIAGGGALNTLSCAAAPSTIVGNVWTSTVAGQVLIVTATVAGNSTWTFTAGTGDPSPAVESNDPNGSQLVGASGAPFAQDMNLTVVVTVAQVGGTLSVSSTTTGVVAGVSPGAGPWTLTFTATGQIASVAWATGTITSIIVTALAGATPAPVVAATADATTLTLIEVADVAPGYTLVWGANFVTGTEFTSVTTTTFPDFLWRFFGTTPNWERVNIITAGAPLGVLKADAAYATNGTVFYFTAGNTTIYKSTNNGDSFSSTAWLAPPALQSMLVLSGTSLVVGGLNGNIYWSTTSGFIWNTTTNVLGAGYTVTDIKAAGGTNLLAVAVNGTSAQVARSADNGVTWALLPAVGANTDAILTITGGNPLVVPAADYATTGNIFVASGTGVFRYPSAATAAANGWLRVDAGAGPTNDPVTTAAGLVAAPGGPGSTTEGSGMVYAVDSSAPADGDVARIRGLETTAEALDSGPNTSRPLATFGGLWAYPAASGNVQLFTVGTIGGVSLIYVYTDTLGIAGTGVTISLLATVGAGANPSQCTVTWNALPNATNYIIAVNVVRQNSVYTAANSGAVAIAYTAGATTANVTGMLAGTTYFVSVWATLTTTPAIAPPTISRMTSFMFGGQTSFNTPLPVPVTPMNLVPAVGDTNVPVLPNFGWATVLGATSYQLQLTLASDAAFASPIYNNATVPYVTGPTTTFNYTGTALLNNTSYIWRVKANGVGPSDWVYGNFTTIPAVLPVVTVPPAISITIPPVPTIVIPANPPAITITQVQPGPAVTVPPQQTIVLTTPPAGPTPTYIWVIVGVGALLTLAVIVLIIRTRRVV